MTEFQKKAIEAFQKQPQKQPRISKKDEFQIIVDRLAKNLPVEKTEYDSVILEGETFPVYTGISISGLPYIETEPYLLAYLRRNKKRGNMDNPESIGFNTLEGYGYYLMRKEEYEKLENEKLENEKQENE
jgi:hypothetical protein